MIHYGDITKIKGSDVPVVDVVCGGSPCQDLSVAGKRAGLAGERSGLFMEQIRIIKEMREHDRESRGSDGRADEYIRPRYMVWENVPGAFSSNGGKDFHAVLEETAKVAERDASIPGFEGKWPSAGCIMGNGWSIAWRVHDAQFWGVPQRRKRISLVADFGGETAPEILFERKSVSGDIAQGGKEGEGTSGNVERSVGETSKCLNSWDVQSKHIQLENGIAETLYSGECRYGGGESYVMQNQKAVVYGISAYDSNAMKSSNPNSGVYEAETARTLDPNGGNPACNQGGIAVVSVENHPADSRVKISEDGKVQALTSRMGTGGGNVPMVMEQPTCLTQSAMAMQAIGEYKQSDAASSLKMRDYKDATDLVVSYGLDRASFNQGMNAQYDFAVDEEKIGTQVAKGPGAVASFYPQMKAESQCWREDDVSNTLVNGTNPGYQNGICTPVVRRLTPLECERLQGYPDYWTDIGDWVDSKGKTHKGDSDSPRYKALGNSIALPFWSWMAGRMVRNLRPGCTMASLFDGIGGFPFVFLGWGCEPVWASEIEEFPIAVTKIRFPEDEDGRKNC